MGKTSATQIDHIRQWYRGVYIYPAVDIHRMRKILSLIGTGKRMLDVGAYDGRFSEQIMPAGNDVVAMDASADALAAAKGRKIETVLCDATAPWLFLSASFDVVFAVEILENIIDTDYFTGVSARVAPRLFPRAYNHKPRVSG